MFVYVQTNNDYGDDFCLRYGEPINPNGRGLPLATVGRAMRCPGYENWIPTGQVGDEYLCCNNDNQQQNCQQPPPL